MLLLSIHKLATLPKLERTKTTSKQDQGQYKNGVNFQCQRERSSTEASLRNLNKALRESTGLEGDDREDGSRPNDGSKVIASNVCRKGSRLQKLPTNWITPMIDYADFEGLNHQKETLGEPKA
jgi:hypothetical protein